MCHASIASCRSFANLHYVYASEGVPTCKEITEEGATNTQVRLLYEFSQILGKNRGCGLYSGATCSPEKRYM